MTTRHCHFVCLAAALVACAVLGRAARSCIAAEANAPASDPQVQSQLEQAIESIIAAARINVAAAADDPAAIVKAQQSLEAIRLIGQLGDFSTNAQTDRLMEELRANARPSVIETLVRAQFENRVRLWQQLRPAERAEAVQGFVRGVQKIEVSPAHSELLIRVANIQDALDNGDQSKLVTNAIRALLPQFQQWDSQQEQNANGQPVKKLAPRLEGIARRFDLVGNPLELEGKLLDGTELDWKAYRGKVVLVDFHASWCGPCRAEVPNVLKYYQAYHDKGFEVIGVNMDTDRQLAERYIQETGANFPTIFSDDPASSGWDSPLAVRYGVTGIPRVILVDQEGKVVSTRARGPRLGQMLEKLLGQVAEDAGENKSSSDESPKSNAG